jgi:two-component sensor histidine kinase/putative methionine-R-sulfoxide reductase with GAF domain
MDMTKNGTASSVRRPSADELLRQRRALADFGTLALQEVDLDKLLTEAARLCAEGLKVPYCKVLEYREAEQDLIVRAGCGWGPDVVGHSLARADASNPGGAAFLRREPVLITDVNTVAEFVLPEIYPQHNIVASANVVIAGREGQPYGVLECDSPEPREFTEVDFDFLQGYANVLAEAVGRLRRQESERRMAREQAVLIRELQHRVRNNLQILHDLTVRHARAADLYAAQRGFADIERRVMTLGSLYNHLLGAGLDQRVDLGAYLSSLCADIAAFQDHHAQQVNLTCQVAEVRVDLDLATTLGVVVNELVSNAFEHAFRQNSGTIILVLEAPEDHRTRLTISDDGVGLLEPIEGSTGLGLVKILVEAIGGTLAVRTNHGTTWLLSLPVEGTP